MKGINSDPVSIKGICMVPSLVESRNRKYILSRKKSISKFSKITTNDSVRQKTEKTPKRNSQRDLKDKDRQSTVKPVRERTTEAKTHQTMKPNEKKLKVFHKRNTLKPIVYQDPILLQLRADKEKHRTEKKLLKIQDEKKKVQQRLEIYALNELMKTLENAEFQRFCKSQKSIANNEE